MDKDLTLSSVDRQNILNNRQAIDLLQKEFGVTGMLFEGEYKFTIKMVLEFYDISLSTLRRYISAHEEEIKANGYEVISGQKLKDFKTGFDRFLIEEYSFEQSVTYDTLLEKNLTNKAKNNLKSLALFNFRALLNIGMMLSESEKAEILRSSMLDIVIDLINAKTNGQAKYINQREEDFLLAIAREPIYRKEFTLALKDYLDMGKYKYALYTDLIYKVIFLEKANEYKKLLNLNKNENIRDTLYSEVLRLIASFEVGIADAIKNKYDYLGRKLKQNELDLLIEDFSQQRLWIPQLEDVRLKMASRDYGLRNVIHDKLSSFVKAVTPEDHERFLGEKSKSLIERISESPELLDVFKRLKDR